MLKKILTIVLLSIVFTLANLSNLALAEDPPTPPIRKERLPTLVKPSTLPGPVMRNEFDRTGRGTTQYLTTKLIPKIAIRISSYIAIGAIIGLMYAGFLYISDLGEENNLEKAKNVIIYSIVALFVAVFAFAIVQIVNLLPLNIIS